MSQADAAPITGVPILVGGKSAADTGKIINLADRRAPRLRADLPPFDPTNANHLRAWEASWDMAQVMFRRVTAGSECGL